LYVFIGISEAFFNKHFQIGSVLTQLILNLMIFSIKYADIPSPYPNNPKNGLRKRSRAASGVIVVGGLDKGHI